MGSGRACAAPGKGRDGQADAEHRSLVEGAIYRYRTGIAWRDLPTEVGPWQTVWKRRYRFATDGTWDKVLTVLQVQADAEARSTGGCSVHQCPGASARRDRREASREADITHRGLGRMTRMAAGAAMNRPIMGSVGPLAL